MTTACIAAAMPATRAEAYAPYGLFELDLAGNHPARIRTDALLDEGFG